MPGTILGVGNAVLNKTDKNHGSYGVSKCKKCKEVKTISDMIGARSKLGKIVQ